VAHCQSREGGPVEGKIQKEENNQLTKGLVALATAKRCKISFTGYEISFTQMLRTNFGNAAIAAVAFTLTGAELAFPSVAASFPFFTLEEATVSSINRAFDSGMFNAKQLVQLYLNRIATYDGSLNSIITVNPDALTIAAALDTERLSSGPRSPLHGIPVILKDNFDTFDMPTTAGSAVLAGSTPPDDAFLVKQLRNAGAIIFAKANMSEFAAGVPGGSLSGLTKNPYNSVRTPAGSSGGTGAAIAANFGVIGTGSDTGGSIRGPATANGLVGIKPTLGLLSRDGIIPLALSFDTGGPMTRTVEDAAIALGIMTGIDPNDPVTTGSAGLFYKDYTPFLQTNALQGARIGVARDFFGGDPERDLIMEDAISRLSDLGATIVDSVLFPSNFLTEKNTIYTRVRWPEFKVQIPDYLGTLAPGYPKNLEDIIAFAETDPFFVEYPARLNLFRNEQASVSITDPDYLDALTNGLAFVRNTTLDLFTDNALDAIIYPTATCSPGPLPNLSDPTYSCISRPSATNIANLTGLPDIQVPAGFTPDNLPMTISFLGPDWSEPKLLGYAYAFEQATNARRPSPLFPPLAGETVPVPGPSPILGVGAAFSYLRRMKKRSNQLKSFTMN
jgi:amidase